MIEVDNVKYERQIDIPEGDREIEGGAYKEKNGSRLNPWCC